MSKAKGNGNLHSVMAEAERQIHAAASNSVEAAEALRRFKVSAGCGKVESR